MKKNKKNVHKVSLFTNLSYVLKQIATELYKTLSNIEQSIQSGNTDLNAILQQGRDRLTAQDFEVDYLEVRTPDLQPVTHLDQDIVVLVAARLGTTRLIDNLLIRHVH